MQPRNASVPPKEKKRLYFVYTALPALSWRYKNRTEENFFEDIMKGE